MDSSEIKTVLMTYLRFSKGCDAIASEAGYFNSDVLASKQNMLYEFEVKTSKADLTADFKKPKHKVYKTIKSRTSSYVYDHVPNYFYFAVPQELAEFALSKTLNTPYGVAVVDSEDNSYSINKRTVLGDEARDIYIKFVKDTAGEVLKVETGNPSPLNSEKIYYTIHYKYKHKKIMADRVRIIKRSKKLHNNPIHAKCLHIIQKRMGSELVSLRQKLFHLMKNRKPSDKPKARE